MSCLPHAEVSPRIEKGMLLWYLGDTFELDIHLDLIDQDREPVTLGEGAEVEVVFSRLNGKAVKTFSFDGDEIEDNTVTLVFDSEVSALFCKGEYTYDIYCTVGGHRTTLANDNRVAVE